LKKGKQKGLQAASKAAKQQRVKKGENKRKEVLKKDKGRRPSKIGN